MFTPTSPNRKMLAYMSPSQSTASRRRDESPRQMKTVAAIEHHVVGRLAERDGRDAIELLRELRLADRDLPVEAELLRTILPVLEEDFGVFLQEEARLLQSLSYARDFALFVRKRMLGAHSGVGRRPRREDMPMADGLGRAA